MSKYRFKTKEEFIIDKLWDYGYDCPIFWNSKGEMNKYLGKDIPDEFSGHCDKNTSFTYGEWHFKEVDYVLKEQQEYFNDLSQHIGRYIRALVDNPTSGHSVRRGDVGKIISNCQADFLNHKAYYCKAALSEDYLGTRYELLPEDYSPEQEDVPERISFYVKYTEEFTEDLYNALWEWSKKNSEFLPRGFLDSYEGLKIHKFYIFDNWTLNCHGKYGGTSSNKYSYGVDNNKQNCEEEYSIEQVKKLIGYKEPSVEFISGKWYNFTTMEGKYNLYVKASYVTDKNLFFMNRESISDGYFGEATCIELKLIENPRLVEDLSEIQKYLPNEHPDKITKQEFEVGKWYKWYQKDHENYHYGKVEGVDVKRNTFNMSPWVISCNEYNDRGSFNLSKAEQIQEISVEEIQEFLPENHPDKITSNKFKKGEYIVLIDNGQSTGGTTLVQSDQFIKNHCYKVRENKVFLRPELDSNGSTTNGWKCIPYNPNKFHKTRNWRYATQKEIDEYERRGKPYDVTELNKQSFPDEGSIEIKYIPENLINYLENNNRQSVSGDSSYNKEKVIIAWNKSSYWFCSVGSSKIKYSKDYIERIIGQSIYSDSLLENKKELSMREIQEECKKKYPIGCTFIPVGSCMHRILKEDSCTYKIVDKQIWAHSGAGYLYEDGKWAELVSLSEEEPKKFEKPDVLYHSKSTIKVVKKTTKIKKPLAINSISINAIKK